jgi:hypothetical protein
MIQGIRFLDIAGPLANDEREFNFPVGFVTTSGRIKSSFGPQNAELALKKRTGSSGISMPDSAA